MKKSLQNKLDRFLSKDYEKVRIKKGQEWYLGKGVYMDEIDTKKLLLDMIEIMKEEIQTIFCIDASIENSFSDLQVTSDLYSTVLCLGECLSSIEHYASQLVRYCDELEKIEQEARYTYYVDDHLPF